MPLSMSAIGDVAVITAIHGHDDIRQRLSTLGLTEGTTVKVIAVNGGNLIIDVRGSRLALDAKLCHRIFVNKS